MKTEAIRIEKHGGPEVLKLVETALPKPAHDEVQIEHRAIGLNFIDTYYRTGLYSQPLPHGLGFEAAGVVVAKGSAVTEFEIGDRVAYAQGPLGAYARARNISAAHVVPLHQSVSFEDAAAILLKGLTVHMLFRQVYRLQGGETILFHAAAGGVGLIACQWARELGVRLIGTVSNDEKARLVRAYGAWEVINYKTEKVPERVLELTGGHKLPVVYDGVGKDTWADSLDCVEPRGLMVSFGNASGPVEGVGLATLAQKGSLYVTRPVLFHHTNTAQKLRSAAKDLFKLVKKGRIRADIGQRFSLHDAGKAHQALVSRKTTGSTIFTLD